MFSYRIRNLTMNILLFLELKGSLEPDQGWMGGWEGGGMRRKEVSGHHQYSILMLSSYVCII